MKFLPAILALLGVALNGGSAAAQTASEDADQRARQVLRNTLREQEAKGGGTAAARSGAPTYEELERQYLAHQITARQFQQYIREFKLVPLWPAAATGTNAPPSPQPAVPKTVPAAPAAPPPASTVVTSVKPAPPPGQTRVAEVEAKMDELLLLQAARERAKTNTPPPATGSTSKRERLNGLLRQVVEGNLSDAEYKKLREKILAEPD